VLDFLNRDHLLTLGLDPATVERLLHDSPLSGHDGRPVVEEDRLAELLEMLNRERGHE
jgi:hypothetical protein